MRKIILSLFALFLTLNCVSQKRVQLKSKREGVAYDNFSKLNIYCIVGFNDSINIFINKKLIYKKYIKSLSDAEYEDWIIPSLSILKGKKNLLEIKNASSKKVYYTYIKPGYGSVLFYLADQCVVVYTNDPPRYE